MPKISLVFKRIITDFPALTFQEAADFHWSPDARIISHPFIITTNDICLLLHEISHAQLKHSTYARDAELLTMERDAWQHAVDHLAKQYDIQLAMDDDIIEHSLDSYRQWLHARSTCPHCQAIGVERSTGDYYCLACHGAWTVNEARTCQLRRYKQ